STARRTRRGAATLSDETCKICCRRLNVRVTLDVNTARARDRGGTAEWLSDSHSIGQYTRSASSCRATVIIICNEVSVICAGQQRSCYRKSLTIKACTVMIRMIYASRRSRRSCRDKPGSGTPVWETDVG